MCNALCIKNAKMGKDLTWKPVCRVPPHIGGLPLPAMSTKKYKRHGMAICQAFSLLWTFKVGCLPYCQPKFPRIRCPVNTLNRICCLNSGFWCFICLIYKRCSSSLNFSLSIRLFEPTVSGRVKEGGLRVVAATKLSPPSARHCTDAVCMYNTSASLLSSVGCSRPSGRPISSTQPPPRLSQESLHIIIVISRIRI